MGRFQRALNAACDRMDDIQNYAYWAASQKQGAVLSEQAFYVGGPVCLVATLPDGTQRSTIKSRYVVRDYWTA